MKKGVDYVCISKITHGGVQLCPDQPDRKGFVDTVLVVMWNDQRCALEGAMENANPCVKDVVISWIIWMEAIPGIGIVISGHGIIHEVLGGDEWGVMDMS
jgi:hypothetical protein